MEETLNEIINLAEPGIPYYAYGDNEAACQMATNLNRIAELCRMLTSQLESPAGVPKPSTTCEKNVCANCKHFVGYDLMKDLQNGCINNEVAEITYVNEPDKFGCTFFEQREA